MRVRSSGIIPPSAGFVCLFSEMLCGLSATQYRSCNPIYGLKPEEQWRGTLCKGASLQETGSCRLFGDDEELSEKVKTLQLSKTLILRRLQLDNVLDLPTELWKVTLCRDTAVHRQSSLARGSLL